MSDVSAGGRDINNLNMSKAKKKEESKMISKMREKCKNKKGFTLVELIVVLVILAILIALLVPALTGYIDKANEKKALAEAKLVLNAVQTVESNAYSEAYDKGEEYKAKTDDQSVGTGATSGTAGEILKLSEVQKFTTLTYQTNEKGKVTKLVYQKAKNKATYTLTEGTGKWEAETVTGTKKS